MPNIWLTSDNHFRHANMYKFTTFDGITRVRHEFESAEEGDLAMIERWNEVVRPEDKVWHLGDFTCYNAGAVAQIACRLNGHKRIVLGNHDPDDPRVWRNAGFEKVTGMHHLDKVWLTHCPMHPSNIAPKFLGNIHGHIHYLASPPGPYVNVSVERWDYYPVEFGVVKDLLRKLKETTNG